MSNRLENFLRAVEGGGLSSIPSARIQDLQAVAAAEAAVELKKIRVLLEEFILSN